MDYEKLGQIILEKVDQRPEDMGAYQDLLSLCGQWEKTDEKAAHRLNKTLRGRSAAQLQKSTGSSVGQLYELWRRSLLFDTKVDFDAYAQYIELDREPEKRFYAPRRRQLHKVAKELQRLADGDLELLSISLPPGVGKTTLALFFLTWTGGRFPRKPILSGSHSNAFLRGAYDECLRIMAQDGEYLFRDVFPEVRILSTNAQDMMIDLGAAQRDKKRFSTLEFSSIGSGNAGKVRAESLLYCDDLVEGIEQAMSRERMDTLWTKYTTDLRQRKIGKCRELHIATRWSVHDVIGRLEQQYGDSDKAKFLTIPALDEDDKSNFDYGNHAGFTTEFYHDQRQIMDDASWRALYMNEPIEREGQLYDGDTLRRYFSLPDAEPDSVLSVCDTKDKGTDFCFMPIVYQYGQDYYLEDCVLDNGRPEAVEAQLVSKLLEHKVQMSQFESNSAGGRVAEKVQKEVKDRGGITKITTRFTTQNKETKIIVNSPYVKDHVLFKDDSVVKDDKIYRRMLTFLCGYTMAGKNKHDDVPDGMAQLAQYVQTLDGTVVTVFKRPF